MIKPYKHQISVIDGIRNKFSQGFKKVILTAATGFGKTICFSLICQSAIKKNKKVLILTHRSELLNQSGGTLQKVGLSPSQIAPKEKADLSSHLNVAMAQTLKRRLDQKEYVQYLGSLDLIIIDEAHTQDANPILPYLSDNAYVIGATATPHREGNQESLHLFYQTMVNAISIKELIDLGFLARPRTFGVEIDLSGVSTTKGEYDITQMGNKYIETKVYEGVYENYNRITPNQKALIFSPNIEASKNIVKEFTERGLQIKHLDGTTPDKERTDILQWFKNTPGSLLSNYGILTAGFDEPTIEVVILYRATKAVTLFLQMCGRGSRTTETKKTFTILDFGNNMQRFGLWEIDREWSLIKAKKKEGIAPVKNCPKCDAILAVSIPDCPYCGFHFPPTKKEMEDAEIARLKLLTKEEIETADFETLDKFAAAKNYNASWVWHRLKDVDLKAYAKYKNYNPGWIQRQLKNREK